MNDKNQKTTLVITGLLAVLLVPILIDSAYAETYTTTIDDPNNTSWINDQIGSGTNANCGGGDWTRKIDGHFRVASDRDSQNNGWCRTALIKIDLSSIPDDAIINDVQFNGKAETEIVSTQNSFRYVDYGDSDCATDSAEVAFERMKSGTSYAWSGIPSTDSMLSVNLGSTANTDIQNSLEKDYWCFSISFGPFNRVATEDTWHGDPSSSNIAITYNNQSSTPAPSCGAETVFDESTNQCVIDPDVLSQHQQQLDQKDAEIASLLAALEQCRAFLQQAIDVIDGSHGPDTCVNSSDDGVADCEQ